MGAGRKTTTYQYDTAKESSRHQRVQFRLLPREQLGGCVFGCTKETFSECVTKELFGLPYNHMEYVQNIAPGMPLFLFNYSDRRLHGIFEAVSHGDLEIDPHGWTGKNGGQTRFPAQ
ncbi:unnamed protein product, partial [Closterium sp. NIES-54]